MLWFNVALLIVACSITVGGSNASLQADKVELTVIKLTQFEKALKAHEGKVVVVYLWGDYSAPDRKVLADQGLRINCYPNF